MKPTKLCVGVLAPDLSGAHGWSQAAVSVIRALVRQGVAVRVVASRRSPDLDDLPVLKVLPDVVPPERFTLARLLACYPRVRHFLQGCDVLQNMVEVYAPLAALFAARLPVFMMGNGTYVNLPRMRRFPVGALYRWAFLRSTMICISHYTERTARAVLPALKTHVVTYAVGAPTLRGVTRAPAPVPTVLTVGGVKARKGTLELVEAMAQVRDVLPDVRCLVVGRADESHAYTRRVRAAIVQHHLEDTVTLTGFVDDATLRAYYAQAHVFVLPSVNNGHHFEGFGLVHLEASSLGLPVIGTTGCGVEDAVVHGETGLLVSQERLAQELPAAILTLLQDSALARRLGENGARRAAAYSWDDVARAFLALYDAHVGSA